MMNRQHLMTDAIAGLTGAIAGAPQAMGFALIAGVSPIYGLYTAIVATIVGSLTSSSGLLTIAPTNALSLVVFSTFEHDATFTIEKVFVLSLLVGLFQVAFGVLRLGFLTRFVSNAVMTGFITGAGLLIVLGQLSHVNGYKPQTSGIIPGFIDWLIHLPQSDPQTFVIGVVSVVMIGSLHHTKRWRSVATLITIFVTTVFVLVMGWSNVELVQDMSPISSLLPSFVMPKLDYVPDLISPALAIAVLALVQAAALTQSLPKSDGRSPDMNRDFLAQGLANVAGGFFQTMPSGGSLSRTAVNISAGAKTRLANIFSGVLIAITIVFFNHAIEKITLAALAGHLIVAATSLIRLKDIRFVWKVGLSPRSAMVATFLATLFLPLEVSIYIGVVLSLGLYVYSSAQASEVQQIVRDGPFRYRVVPMVERLPARETVILSMHGHLYFAAVRTIETLVPDAKTGDHTIVIFRMRESSILGSTAIRFLDNYRADLCARGGDMILCGVSERMREQMYFTGTIEHFGEENLFEIDETFFGSLERAYESAQVRLATIQAPETSVKGAHV